MLGTIQAAEAIKYIVGDGELLTNRILMFNALTKEFRTVLVKKTEWGNLASENTKITSLIDYEQAACDIETSGGTAAVKVGTVSL
jgi:adenylyltransferase/sulfurtransferase